LSVLLSPAQLTEPSRSRAAEAGTFQIGEIAVRVRSDGEGFSDDFAGLYASHAATTGLVRDPIEARVEVCRRLLPPRRRYAISGDGKKFWSVDQACEVLPHLEWAINWRVIETRGEFLQIHAAALSFNGQGLLIAADSGSGKSTLALGLLTRGWQYLSDEFALIRPDTLQMHPFPKALCAKAGSFPVVERLGLSLWGNRHYVKALKGAVGYIRPMDIRPDILAAPCPIRWVVLVQYRPQATPRVYPVSKGLAAFALASNALNRGTHSSRANAILAEVTRHADSYRCDAGDLIDTCSELESTFRADHQG
jgi:HprK-related kinase A